MYTINQFLYKIIERLLQTGKRFLTLKIKNVTLKAQNKNKNIKINDLEIALI